MSRRRTLAAAAALVCLALLMASAWVYRDKRQRRAAALSLQLRLADTVRPAPADIVACATVAPPGTLVILALGQSSAANHGQAQPPARRVAMLTDQGCLWATDPLPGATGRGGSTWLHLPAALAAWPDVPPVLLSVLAIESTSIADWTQAHSPLRARLLQHLGRMAEQGYPPAWVLWDQGAADAMRHTTPEAYKAGLETLAGLVRSNAPSARILLAPTTLCRNGAALQLHEVVSRLVAADPRFGPGPLLDTVIPATERYDGCHFSAAGLRRAADAWARALQRELSARR